MCLRIIAALAAIFLMATTAEARRVALVVGQNAYPGSFSAAIGLPRLDNPGRDARGIAELLRRYGFEVLSCDGTRPGCFDLNRTALLAALSKLEDSAKGADMALVYFAGHGLASDEGNILAPIDASIDCATGAVAEGIPVERLMQATEPAKHKLLILDACRDNPLGLVCPALKGKKLSFTRIEVGAFQGLLLVTSTQFGQQALDGAPGTHSPFASALMTAFEANPGIYFEQVMNEVARTTYDAAQAQEKGFIQIPGKLVGGAAPADCLAGKGCTGDARMSALAIENERLSAEATAARAEAQRQASQAAKNREIARMQRLLLSPGPVAEIKMGSDDAPVMIIEYCALWAAYCHVQHRKIMPTLTAKYIDTGLVQYIYRDIPSVEAGIQTHMIANCLGSAQRGRLIEALYQGVPTGNRHFEIAQQLGLPKDRIDSCLADQQLRRDVESMNDRLKLLNISAIPTFFVNGEPLVGTKSLEFFEEKLKQLGVAAQ